jgi:hypothetical protein
MPNSIDTFPVEGRQADAALVREIAELIRSALNLEVSADGSIRTRRSTRKAGPDSMTSWKWHSRLKRYGFRLDDDQTTCIFRSLNNQLPRRGAGEVTAAARAARTTAAVLVSVAFGRAHGHRKGSPRSAPSSRSFRYGVAPLFVRRSRHRAAAIAALALAVFGAFLAFLRSSCTTGPLLRRARGRPAPARSPIQAHAASR